MLDALAAFGATSAAYHVKSSTILNLAWEQNGLGPRYGYDVLCDLARPWQVHLRLVDFNGNYGSRDFSAAMSRYTEARLSPLGELALAVERGYVGPLPFGLINGSMHVDGPTPPFDPRRLLSALRAVDEGADDEAVTVLLGPPSSPTGCEVRGDVDELLTTGTAELILLARIEKTETSWARELIISALPPGSSAREVVTALDRTRSLPIVDINDHSTGLTGIVEIGVRLTDEADPASVAERLREMWPLRQFVTVRMGASPAVVLRRWMDVHAGNDATSRLDQLEALLER